MSLTQYVKTVTSRWLLVLCLTVAGVLGAALYTQLVTPKYSSTVELFVTVNGAETGAQQLSQGNIFTEARVKSYAAIVVAPKFLRGVIDQLQLPYTPKELAKRVTATTPLDTVLLDVEVIDSSPKRAADIANAIASNFSVLIEQLEKPAGQTASPVKVSVIQDADVDNSPVSPVMPLDLGVGLLLGLFLGVGIALLRQATDRTIRKAEDASEAINVPLLGALPNHPDSADRPLNAAEGNPWAGSGPWAEAVRQLRTNTKFLSVDKKLQSLVVTGSVPGEGKTTVAVNLAVALAQAGQGVVLIDGDLRRPRCAEMFSLPGSVGLTNVILGEVTFDRALQRWREDVPLYILASGQVPPNPSELLGSERLSELVKTLQESGMMVIFDSPPLLPVTDAAIISRVTGGALVVTRSGSTRIDQLRASIRALETAGAPVLGLIVNRVKVARGSAAYASYYQNPAEQGLGRATSA